VQDQSRVRSECHRENNDTVVKLYDISVGHDALIETAHSFTLLGAADALGILGTGVYYGEKDQEAHLCSASSPQASETPEDAEPTLKEGTHVIATDLGNFEIDTFADGSGFLIRLDGTGETLKVNVLHDFDDSIDKIVMVFSELRSSSSQSMLRKVSIVDFDGNTFSCAVDVLRKNVQQGTMSETEEPVQDELLMTIPCSPSMFGPTQFASLRNQDEIIVESRLSGLMEDNQYGCNVPSPLINGPIPDTFISIHDDSEESIEQIEKLDSSVQEPGVQLVQRGECTFFAKAFNSRKEASAVIVINNVDDEVFMMSSSEDEDKDVDPLDLPLSVLITGLDGEALSTVAREEAAKANTVIARVSVRRRLDSIGADGLIVNGDGETRTDRIYWPVVRGSADLLEILVESGWGVRGLQIQGNDSKEWQIQLLRHLHAGG
jgi:hypothetical protein